VIAPAAAVVVRHARAASGGQQDEVDADVAEYGIAGRSVDVGAGSRVNPVEFCEGFAAHLAYLGALRRGRFRTGLERQAGEENSHGDRKDGKADASSVHGVLHLRNEIA